MDKTTLERLSPSGLTLTGAILRVPRGCSIQGDDVNFYDGLDVHRLLVADEVRTRAFYDSIRATVRSEDVVLDVGAGSGILSLFAARAGASRVYAVERAPGAAALARRLVAVNGLADVVHIIEAEAAAAVLPEPVDVIVSEWLGVYGVDENMLAPVLLARDRWLKPGGSMIPSAVTAWLAPVHHEAGREATLFRTRPYGLDLSALAPFSPHQVVWLPRSVGADVLRAAPQPLWVTDCAAMPTVDAHTPYAAELSFELNGPANGALAWFSAEMPGAAALTNAPGEPVTHWGNFLFPIANAQEAAAGARLSIGFHNMPAGALGSHHLWSSRLDDQPLEIHDTRRHSRAGWEPPWRSFLG